MEEMFDNRNFYHKSKQRHRAKQLKYLAVSIPTEALYRITFEGTSCFMIQSLDKVLMLEGSFPFSFKSVFFSDVHKTFPQQPSVFNLIFSISFWTAVAFSLPSFFSVFSVMDLWTLTLTNVKRGFSCSQVTLGYRNTVVMVPAASRGQNSNIWYLCCSMVHCSCSCSIVGKLPFCPFVFGCLHLVKCLDHIKLLWRFSWR